MAWLALTVKIVLGILAGLTSIVGIAYAADYGIEATVTEVHCAGGDNPFFPRILANDSSVTVHTNLFSIGHTVSLSRDICMAVRPNNFVIYNIRSGHTTLYEDSSMSRCLYDSNSATGVCT